MVDSGHPVRCPVCNAPLQPGATACRECGRPLQVPAARRTTPAAPAAAPAALPAFSEPGKKELGMAISVWLALGTVLSLIGAFVLAIIVANTAHGCLAEGQCTTREIYQYLTLGIGLALAAAVFAAIMGHSLGWRWRGRL